MNTEKVLFRNVMLSYSQLQKRTKYTNVGQHIPHFGLVSCLKLTAFPLHKADNRRRPQFSSIVARKDH